MSVDTIETAPRWDGATGLRVPPDALALAGGLCLDRIVELHIGTRAVARANVPHTLTVFDTHFQRFPVLPGVLMMHGLANLAGTLLAATAGGRWQLTGARRMQFRHYVRPGDQLRLEVDIRAREDAHARLSGRITCADTVVVLARELTMTHDSGRGKETP
ncbi:3-hydroxyacyl-ACP dehydratase FabZ family protein [Nocardia sp. NPDC127526]|uniref:3-hydroxyacyl-ACP dehydratase FabZ family protein n=1 Tax=Nocardia sp. NPDC127526 TaxID=3345393 RepID=UPI003629CC50